MFFQVFDKVENGKQKYSFYEILSPCLRANSDWSHIKERGRVERAMHSVREKEEDSHEKLVHPSQKANPFLLTDKELLLPYKTKQTFALTTLSDFMKSLVLEEPTNRIWSLVSPYLPNTTRHSTFYLLF